MSNGATEGFRLREEGIEANLAAGNTVLGESERIKAVVDALIDSGTEFTADTVHDALKDGPLYTRLRVASVIGSRARTGLIVRCDHRGLVASGHQARHGSKNSWWIAASVAERAA
jgi:hypothetical protein